MSPLEFLSAVWPSEGLYCIATPLVKGFAHEVFETIGAAAAHVDKIAREKNVFFACHTLLQEKVWNDKHHRDPQDKTKWVPAWSVRLQTNSKASRVFFFDLDVEVGNPDKYDSRADANAGLRKFLLETGLPIPLITTSGGGLHVYWRLDQGMDSRDWRPYAEKLRAIATHHGLRYDPARTTDSASVLRVAGTFNHKTDTPRPVVVLTPGVETPVQQFCDALDKLVARDQIVFRDRPSVALPEGLTSNTEAEEDKNPPSMEALFKVCGQVRKLGLAKGNLPEPEWRVLLGAVKFTNDGRGNCHKISNGYPGYSRDETDSYHDRWTAGPATCAEIASKCGPARCDECPFKGKNNYTSPIPIARLVDSAPPPIVFNLLNDVVIGHGKTIPNPPAPYRRTPNGAGIVMDRERADGTAYYVTIYEHDIYPLERSASISRETEEHLWRVHLPHTEVKDFVVDAQTLVDTKALAVRLAKVGVFPEKMDEMVKYMSAYVRSLQNTESAAEQHSHLGWNEEKTQFVLPGRVLIPGGEKATAVHKDLAETKSYIGRKGDMAKQIELMRFFNGKHYAARQAFMAASLASVLMIATGHHGLIVSACGVGGSAKSTLLEVGASFWGHPDKYPVNSTDTGMTALRQSHMRDILSSLPILLDEITSTTSEMARAMAMAATQTKGRSTMKNDGTPKDTSDVMRYSLIMTTSNRSLYAMLEQDNTAGTAAAMRVFETEFSKADLIHSSSPDGDDMRRELRENYGHIGERFVRNILPVMDEVCKRVNQTVRRLHSRAPMKSEERYWYAYMACTIVALEIANALHLLEWSPLDVEEFFITQQLPILRGGIAEDVANRSPLTILTSYLQRIDSNMIKMSNKSPSGPLTGQYIQQHVHGPIMAHYNVDTQTMYVLKHEFKVYCEKNKTYATEVLRKNHADGVITNMGCQRVLGKGTPSYDKGQSLVFVVDMSHPLISGAAAVLVASGSPIIDTSGQSVKSGQASP